MIEGVLTSLFIAWILSLFSVDKMLIECIQPFINNVILTSSHYYLLFAIVGLIGGVIDR